MDQLQIARKALMENAIRTRGPNRPMYQPKIAARRDNAPRTREYGSHRVRSRMPRTGREDKQTELMNRRWKDRGKTSSRNRWSLRGAYNRFRNRRRNRSSTAVAGIRG